MAKKLNSKSPNPEKNAYLRTLIKEDMSDYIKAHKKLYPNGSLEGAVLEEPDKMIADFADPEDDSQEDV